MHSDELYMRRCLDLASLGLGKIEPGALVGCVIVYEDRIISEGFYSKNGGDHAEIIALGKIEDPRILKESTLYVSLEPCNHHGKTPPCTEAIIASGIKDVVICNLDSNPKVAGTGIQRLETSGIKVRNGILSEEGKYINRRFLHFHKSKRPYIILKWAETRDGYFAPADLEQKWISSDESKALTHKWRSEEMAILVGRKTAMADNPRLTTRLWHGRNPVRLIIDKNLELDKDLNIYDGKSKTWIFNALKNEEQNQIKLIQLDFSKEILNQIMTKLYELEIQSIIIEGGRNTLDGFITEKLWDEARIFVSSELWGKGKTSPKIESKHIAEKPIGDDQLKIFVNKP